MIPYMPYVYNAKFDGYNGFQRLLLRNGAHFQIYSSGDDQKAIAKIRIQKFAFVKTEKQKY